MKQFLLFLTFSFISTSFLYAQGDGAIPEVQYNQWEAGMDVVWLLKNQVPTVFLRKNTIRPKKNEFGFRRNAYRLSFYLGLVMDPKYQLDTFNLNNSNYNHFVHRTLADNSFGFRLGYEWNKKVKSIGLYYGSDIGSSYYNVKHEYINLQNISYNSQDSFYSVDLIPFVGMKYNITKNILASVESNLIFSYRFSTYIRESPQTYKNKTSWQSAMVSYVPVRMIALSYLF